MAPGTVSSMIPPTPAADPPGPDEVVGAMTQLLRAQTDAMAAQARMTPEEFLKKFKHVVDDSAVKLPASMAHSQVVQIVDDPIESHRGKGPLLPM